VIYTDRMMIYEGISVSRHSIGALCSDHNPPRLSHVHGMSNLLKPTGHVMHQQFNIQQLYALSTLYLCVLYLSENKQRLVPLTA
jgi:hypothetical protein